MNDDLTRTVLERALRILTMPLINLTSSQNQGISYVYTYEFSVISDIHHVSGILKNFLLWPE